LTEDPPPEPGPPKYDFSNEKINDRIFQEPGRKGRTIEGQKNMKGNVVLFSLGLVLVAFLSAMTVSPVAAQSPPARNAPHPITLGVGEAVSICDTGTIKCPAYDPICDDISVATMRRGPRGLEIVGVAPGKTLCSASSSNFTRVPYAVTVR
jgi:hypothetical protein